MCTSKSGKLSETKSFPGKENIFKIFVTSKANSTNFYPSGGVSYWK